MLLRHHGSYDLYISTLERAQTKTKQVIPLDFYAWKCTDCARVFVNTHTITTEFETTQTHKHTTQTHNTNTHQRQHARMKQG